MGGSGSMVDLGAVRVALRAGHPDDADRLEALFAGFRPVAGSDAAHEEARRPSLAGPVVDIEIVRLVGPETICWRGTVDGVPVSESPQREIVEDALTRRVNRLVLDVEVDRLHLHAAAVERMGRVVLIVGPSGSGKSTLTAGLVVDGWRLLSDEQLGVLVDGRLVPYPRAITLRRGAWHLFPELEHDASTTQLGRIEVPIPSLGAAYRGSPVRPDLIVCPDARADVFDVEELTGAAAMQALFAETLDLERSASDGISALTALVAAAPAYRLAGRSLDRSIEAVTSLVATARPPGPAARAVVVTGANDRRVTGTLGWLFRDGSASLHDPHGGMLVETDAAGFEAWEAVASPQGHAVVADQAPAFIAGLEAAGLVG